MTAPDAHSFADTRELPSAAYVRQYLRANLFDGDENGILTVTISYHLDYLTELVIDLVGTLYFDGDDRG
jgi:hypothetical protein